MTVWDELVDEFRTLGGTMDNVRLGSGPLGRGLFVIDPTRPIQIRIPESLLISVANIAFEHGNLTIAPNAPVGARERKFYEDYYAHLSWGAGGREEIERIFGEAQALPPELRQKLLTHYRCGAWFIDPSPELIRGEFIRSRKIGLKAGDVMMPFIELANHGDGRDYEGESDLLLQGMAQDEITVRYFGCDAYGLFNSWGFACRTNVAYSIAMEGAVGGVPLHIGMDLNNTVTSEREDYPALSMDAGIVTLSFCMLGNGKFPRLCRGNFRNVLRKAGLQNVDETFDRLRRNNYLFFLTLLEDLEDFTSPIAHTLRRMARFQLQALSDCYGAREVPPGTRMV